MTKTQAVVSLKSKGYFHAAIFESPVRPTHENQMIPTEKRVMRSRYILVFTHRTHWSFKTR